MQTSKSCANCHLGAICKYAEMVSKIEGFSPKHLAELVNKPEYQIGTVFNKFYQNIASECNFFAEI